MNLFTGWSIRLNVAGLVGTFTLNIENILLCNNCVLDRVNHFVNQINRHGLVDSARMRGFCRSRELVTIDAPVSGNPLDR